MDIKEFFKISKVMMVVGKGGVGKTTVSASLSLLAAGNGLCVRLIELDDKAGVLSSLGLEDIKLSFDPFKVSDNLTIQLITPDEALVDYMQRHNLGIFVKRLVKNNLLDVVATAIPGIKDILILGKIKQLERELQDEVIIVDAPATGHALSFLTSPKGLLDSARTGPVSDQARDVLEFLTDYKRCQVLLVCIPEETPVNETMDAAYQLEDSVGIKLGPLVVNQIFQDNLGVKKALNSYLASSRNPEMPLVYPAMFFEQRCSLNSYYLDMIRKKLPLPLLLVNECFSEEITIEELKQITNQLKEQILRVKGA